MGSTAATSAGRRRAAARKRTAPARHGARRRGSERGKRSSRSPRPGSKRSPRRRRLLVAAAILAALAAGYFLWLRDSPLFAVTEVTVRGAESDDAGRIAAALTRAGTEMTTLNVDQERLEAAVARFPTVESVSADPGFPKSLAIEVVERPPALAIRAGDEEAAVAGDGMVLPGIEPDNALPRLDVERIPEAGRLSGEELDRALVAAAAPGPLAPLVRRVAATAEQGIEARLRAGIVVRFGDAANAAAKWAAAAAVLADPELEAVAYVDVRVPQRPAVGGELIDTIAEPEQGELLTEPAGEPVPAAPVP